MDVAGTLSALTAAIGLAKELKNVDQQLDKADLKLKIAELTSALADAKIGLSDVAGRMKQQEEDISRLQSAIRRKDVDLVEAFGYSFDKGTDGRPVGAAYCPICMPEGHYIRLAEDTSKPGHPSKCPRCRADFGRVERYSYNRQA